MFLVIFEIDDLCLYKYKVGKFLSKKFINILIIVFILYKCEFCIFFFKIGNFLRYKYILK